MAGLTAGTPDYEPFRFAPRAPRVVIVVPGGPAWRYWARLALHGATLTWGGAGFVLAPHEQGVIHPAVLRGLGAYDPDYVMALTPTLADVEALEPGSVDIHDSTGAPLSPEARAAAIASAAGDTVVPDHRHDAARAAVVGACAPYRRWNAQAAEWDEDAQWWSVDGPGSSNRLIAAESVGATFAHVLSAKPDLAGNLGVAVAARAGAIRPPDVVADGDGVDLDAAAAVIRWLVGRSGKAPAVIAGDPIGRDETAFARGLVGLAPVYTRRRPGPMLAAGDTASDFALALLWDRIYGTGTWLPRAWWPTDPGQLGAAVKQALLAQPDRRAPWRLMSTSASPDELELLAEWLRTSKPAGSLGGTQRAVREPQVEVAAIWPQNGVGHLAVRGQYDQTVALPIRRQPGDGGGFEMLADAPLPTVTDPALAHVSELVWEVDLQPSTSPMPSGRGLDGHALLIAPEGSWPTWVRSGRDGTSYNAQRYDFVAAGATPQGQLARPRLRELGLLSWANALGAPAGRAYRLSDAGLRVNILTRMAAGRDALVDMLTGPLHATLGAFNATHKSTSAEYPAGEGVVLADGGYLNLKGMALRAGVPAERARQLADPLLSAGILRRGLVLRCASCLRPSFLPVGRLGQHYECPRCGSQNELVQQRWQMPADEPLWFYDLHPAARELFSQHGDVPLMLAGRLRASSRRYADVAELELVDASSGEPVAESDLLAHVDGKVLVAEAKSTDALADTTKKAREAARKRVLLASELRADEVIMATTAAAWAPSSISIMLNAIRAATWSRGWPPVLRLVTALGTSTPADKIVAT